MLIKEWIYGDNMEQSVIGDPMETWTIDRVGTPF